MASTLTQLTYHCIWSTKDREPLISPKIESDAWAIIADTAKRHKILARRVGGIENHVHALLDIPKTLSVSEAVKQLKGGSSNAINKSTLLSGTGFAWQDGYGAFTVSTSNIQSVAEYIGKQREHHSTLSFEDEFVAFLDKHGVEYDSQYLWG